MKILGTAAVIAGMLTSAALAEAVAPTAVKYDEGTVAMSLSGAAGDPVEGRDIVGNKKKGNCVACHQVTDLSDVPFHGEIGPALDGAGDRWNEAELRGIVANAKLMFEDTMMPAFYKTEGFIRPGKAYTGKAADETFGPVLTAQQIEDVVAYLKTLKE
ncbi:sulfur oxidation c-type cytochrome SoxX [Sulfitobacter mediterraneus]|jgi:L-cysteine S-thiosulfotransferase|uniref:sulfur oxidation c-type cytochrome SoxX n=1 Tax=Sulfitobacter mediterraneus TaxID=83219 RepID=UPI000EA23F76|nr:sulfur oxidation c-type cytochrome SoxX [Sulfitobacter mediterraneus]MBM1557569.1 sulfur oxidation c-type cytochrome SoxX [Sulfitobacter mediterraneus]MBM1569298.1 sulfur oxidation c-type cytochrome SoxX [Sulfitobacter mediterraneus]MBM1572742.1 sulfur oxidation c-type cytochrome SoxX [Sulfitobacter mediterraneus]MBM1576905.1 sulfur oxidation c-type cytochrome SoxX [Sulfitobacter mediterraneus]MBM1580595.1 sulfur oxidation c-type cytochrome SoxX [Sulfitobacter mediterraneus]